MNEIRDLLVGIDLGKEETQLCYYDRRAGEPRSVSVIVGSSQCEIPTLLCRKAGGGDFVVGMEAEYFAREKGGELVPGFPELCGYETPVRSGGEEKEPWELMAEYLSGILKYLGVSEVVKNTRCLAVAVPSLTEILVRNLKKACASLGFSEENCVLMDYEESFYYYAMTQRKEMMGRSVGWYDFQGDEVSFRKLSLFGNVKPFIVKLTPLVTGRLSGEEEERDDSFCKFIQKTLGKDMFSSIQVTGKGFDPAWAKQAVKMLCFQKRKVFYGTNMLARGACYAAKERGEDHELRGYRFLSGAMVQKDVGMEMRVMGSNAWYPLLEGGKNWYECSKSCELILDKETELVFIVGALGENEKKRVSMSLPGLPNRPDKTTRLLLTLTYVSPSDCEIRVEDLGFGELFPSSGKVWKETVQW